MSAIEIHQHKPGESMSDFLEVARIVFEGDAHWVPPLNIMMKDQLSPKSPFFEHAEVMFFTARRHGKLVGRISAQIDQEHLKRHQDETGFFGFLDTVDDDEVGQALLDAAKNWLVDRGMKRVIGPMNLSINQEVGTLVEGFDTPPMIMMPHSRPYQDRVIKSAGFEKCRDLYAWRWRAQAATRKRSLDAHSSMKELGFTFRSADLENEMDDILAIQNDAWKDNWCHVSATRAEADQLKNEMKLIIDPVIAIVIEFKGEVVGMALAIPNLNEAISDFGGKIGPLKAAKLLWRLKVDRPKSARVVMLGIRSDIRKQKKYMPLALALLAEINRRGYQRGYEWAELSWTLEDNGPVNALIRAAGGKIYKRYRVYESPLKSN